MPILLLSLSIILSSARNLFSKNLSGAEFGTKGFFHRQAILFSLGAASLLVFGNISFTLPSTETFIYGVIYGVLLILAQWFYTVALAQGNTALCSTVYSMGFILPTLSGAIFWSEKISVIDIVGILFAVLAILFSKGKADNKKEAGNKHFLPLIIAMLSSGGLGIMQKLQQASRVADERGEFLVIAFFIAATASAAASFVSSGKNEAGMTSVIAVSSAVVGFAFGVCNLLNTALAGMLPSAVFFPTLNISSILLTMLCGIVFFKERLGKKEITVLIFGGISILLLNIG